MSWASLDISWYYFLNHSTGIYLVTAILPEFGPLTYTVEDCWKTWVTCCAEWVSILAPLVKQFPISIPLIFFGYVAQKCQALQVMNKHLEAVLKEKRTLRQRLMKPLCQENLPIEAIFHRWALRNSFEHVACTCIHVQIRYVCLTITPGRGSTTVVSKTC